MFLPLFALTQSGIEIGTGFDVKAATLIDSRHSIPTLADTSTVIATDGLITYVISIDSLYIYSNEKWINMFQVFRYEDIVPTVIIRNIHINSNDTTIISTKLGHIYYAVEIYDENGTTYNFNPISRTPNDFTIYNNSTEDYYNMTASLIVTLLDLSKGRNTLTGVTILSNGTTELFHGLASANFNVEIIDLSGRTYLFPIIGRDSNKVYIYNNSNDEFNDMIVLLINNDK